MVAKMVLPRLGGTPAVWNICMLFYQTLLLAGYAYAHELAKRFTPRRTAVLQVLIAFAAVLVLPVHLPRTLSSTLTETPAVLLLALLAIGVGIPFLVLTTYSSTLQRWYATASRASATEPYVLYSAGNLGSLVGLLSYPTLIERHLGLLAQSRLWQWGYVVLLAMTVCCALTLWLGPRPARSIETTADVRVQITRSQEMKWLGLAFIPSSLMLGVTTALTTELPPIPLLWVLPLAAYLLSFVLVFASRPINYHAAIVRKLPILLVVAAFLVVSKTLSSPMFSIPFYLVLLLFACVACHGELATTRPPVGGLTHFYLSVAIGGVLGGVFNAILAPLIFKTVVELPLVLFLLTIAMVFMGSRRGSQPVCKWDLIFPISLGLVVTGVLIWLSSSQLRASPALNALVFMGPILLCLSFAGRPLRFALGFASIVLPGSVSSGAYGHVVLTERSFFGVYRVMEDGQYRELSHGTTIHGIQSLDPGRASEPLTYYYRTGPIGEVFNTAVIAEHLHEVAVIGLGAGSLACYAAPGRHFTFYEIDPTVETIARNPRYFTFLQDCSRESQVVIGDARLSLQQASTHKYDLVVADAFSSDTVPVHLVTKEAIELYRAKLADHGLLAFNISNRYLDLRPVLSTIARDAGLECLIREDSKLDDYEKGRGKSPSIWVVMARTRADLAALASKPQWHDFQVQPDYPLWTDDYSTLAGVIHWAGIIRWN